MNILIIDDSPVSRLVLSDILREAGYADIILAGSMEEAFCKISPEGEGASCALVDLVLLDVNLPGTDGIAGCRELKGLEQFQDVPVIIVSGLQQLQTLETAFAAGAVDYLNKPFDRTELLVRVRSALRLKSEMDRRKARERELVALTEQLAAANRELQLLSSRDGLTGIANRYAGDEFLDREWRRAARQGHFFSVVMIDIDCFKAYNDTYGHLAGDECLKQVAAALQGQVHRPGDLLVRYGGEEFMALLPGTDSGGAQTVAEGMRAAAAALDIRHETCGVAPHVTVSIGVATTVPFPDSHPEPLIAAADAALYRAKQEGRNRACVARP